MAFGSLRRVSAKANASFGVLGFAKTFGWVTMRTKEDSTNSE